MRILITSDTHGRLENFREAVRRTRPFGLLVHAGDVEGDEDRISGLAQCETIMVRGNNDFFSFLNAEREFMIGALKVFLTHGTAYHVSTGPEWLLEEACSRGADIVIFGHTHRPMIEHSGGLTILNPGSLSYPRQEGRRPSYIVMETDESGGAEYRVEYL
ncbi:MAG: metallophosphoesterase [Lachnospiraceae bacterium]|nr:metallophosphoesterase [Lachnospiraceae bacterium]